MEHGGISFRNRGGREMSPVTCNRAPKARKRVTTYRKAELKLCSVPGCQDPVNADGMCRRHYRRKNGHGI